MRVTIHFDFKPSVTITRCKNTVASFNNDYLLVRTTEESVWDLLISPFERVFMSTDESIKDMILTLYNDGTCSIEEGQRGAIKVTGMSAIEVSEKEFND